MTEPLWTVVEIDGGLILCKGGETVTSFWGFLTPNVPTSRERQEALVREVAEACNRAATGRCECGRPIE